jgi:predicted restriction endonuclease
MVGMTDAAACAQDRLTQHGELRVDLQDVRAALTRLRLGRANGLPSVHQPVTLIWAGKRAAKGEPRLGRWSDVRAEISTAISALGGGSESHVAAYPVLALVNSELWELEASKQAPAAHSSRAIRWINEQDPLVGLSAGAYTLLADDVAFSQFALAAVGKLDEAQARLVLDYFDIDLPVFRGFGEVPGVEVGTVFADRTVLSERQAHRAAQGGITGTQQTGAESVVVSGGYEDDEDYGDLLIYTGHGGRDEKTGRQIADQKPDAPGNAALITSHLTGAPVRVIRGPDRRNPYAPASGYRYDGLFLVERTWQERGRSGFLVCRYRLVRLEPDAVPAEDPGIPTRPLQLPSGNISPSRRSTTADRIARRAALAKAIKRFHDYTCQVCDTRLVISGQGYAEGAHIRPLGRPHDGTDTPDNLLCLCPNCHVLFDNGAILIEDDLRIRSVHPNRGLLRIEEGHTISIAALAYHRGMYPTA